MQTMEYENNTIGDAIYSFSKCNCGENVLNKGEWGQHFRGFTFTEAYEISRIIYIGPHNVSLKY